MMADRQITASAQVETAAVLEAYVEVLEHSDATIRDEAELPYDRAMIKEAILAGLEIAEPAERDPLERAFLSLAYFQPMTEEESEAVAAFGTEHDEEDEEDVARTLAQFGEAYGEVLKRIERATAELSAELADREAEGPDEADDAEDGEGTLQ